MPKEPLPVLVQLFASAILCFYRAWEKNIFIAFGAVIRDNFGNGAVKYYYSQALIESFLHPGNAAVRR